MRILRISYLACLVAIGWAAGAACQTGAAEPKALDWNEILGPAKGSLPAPQDSVVWRDKLAPAMQEAKQENRPLFVTFRCLPCKQCSAFDKDVLEGGGELDPMLKQFITVRLVSAKDLDFRIFPAVGFQDMDLSWWGYFLSPEGRVYGIFGGRDEVSDETRISKAALVKTLGRVLVHHYDPRRAGWDMDGPAPELSGKPQVATELPGYASWAKGRVFDKRTAEANCLHCHQVVEILRQPAIDARTFDKKHDVEIWPLPENVGLKVDRDNGLQVTDVKAASPAAAAGMQKGDLLGMAGGRRLFGQADFRGVLHRGPKESGSIEVAWVRDGKVMTGSLALSEGWRKTDLGWRTSMAGGNIGVSPGFFPVPLTATERKKNNIPDDIMAVHPYGLIPAAKAVGLAQSSIIVSVAGETRNIFGRPLLVWFRLNHEPGESVTVTTRDASGATKDLTYIVTKGPG